jgi:hypothetical protein
MHPENEIKHLRKRATKARDLGHTCPASRHAHMIAEHMLTGGWSFMQEEPENCAGSLLAVVAALWEARSELAKRPDGAAEGLKR